MPAAKSPADELADLKVELDEKQKGNSELAKEMDRLKAQIADLSKTVAEIERKTKAYEKAAGGAGDQQKDLAAYIKTEKTMLEAALSPADAKFVRDAKDAAIKKLSDLSDKLTAATKKAADAATAYAQAKAATVDAQAAYKAVVDLPTATTSILADLTALRASADKQGAASIFGRMYFFILVMVDRLNAIVALTPDEYKKKLNDAGAAVAAASDAEAAAKAGLDAATTDQKQAQKDLDDARAKWRADTVNSIPAAAPAAAPVAAASAAAPVAAAPAVVAPVPAAPAAPAPAAPHPAG